MNTKLIKQMGIKKKKKGFTLIELIIVIAILAVLAALALPKFGSVKDTANKSADLATGKNIQTAISKMIAEDEIALPTTKTAKTVVTSTTDVGKKIDGSLTPKLKANSTKNFSYELDKNGDITVYAGDDQVFPEPAAAYK